MGGHLKGYGYTSKLLQKLYISGKYSLSSFFPTCIMLKAGSILELCSTELTLSRSISKKLFYNPALTILPVNNTTFMNVTHSRTYLEEIPDYYLS